MTPLNASPAAYAELALLEMGSVIVDDEDLALELLTRVHRYGVRGRSEPTTTGFRVTIHPSGDERPEIELDLPAAIKRAGQLAHRPSPLLEGMAET